MRGKTASRKIALGHHRDDIVETLFLNMFYGGRLKAMPPKLLSEDRRHIVIRPLAYVPSATSSATPGRANFRSFPARSAARSRTCSACGQGMLAGWEREHPGRTEAIFSALRNVHVSHLADPASFDFAGLTALRAVDSGAETAIDDAPAPVHEPWEAD